MALRRNTVGGGIRSALRTYNSALYAARATTATVRAIKRRLSARKERKHSNVVNMVRQKTRGSLATNPLAYSKGTIAGLDRRKKLAERLKQMPRKKRSRTGDVNAIKSNRIHRTKQSYPGKITLERNMTGRQLGRRVRQYKRRGYIGDLLKEHKGNRKETAQHILAHRKMGVRPKFKTNAYDPMLKKSIANFRKAFANKK